MFEVSASSNVNSSFGAASTTLTLTVSVLLPTFNVNTYSPLTVRFLTSRANILLIVTVLAATV